MTFNIRAIVATVTTEHDLSRAVGLTMIKRFPALFLQRSLQGGITALHLSLQILLTHTILCEEHNTRVAKPRITAIANPPMIEYCVDVGICVLEKRIDILHNADNVIGHTIDHYLTSGNFILAEQPTREASGQDSLVGHRLVFTFIEWTSVDKAEIVDFPEFIVDRCPEGGYHLTPFDIHIAATRVSSHIRDALHSIKVFVELFSIFIWDRAWTVVGAAQFLHMHVLAYEYPGAVALRRHRHGLGMFGHEKCHHQEDWQRGARYRHPRHHLLMPHLIPYLFEIIHCYKG